MPVVVFVLPGGAEHSVEAAVGETVMDAALDNGIPGIRAQCGGACTCSTCHVHVETAWLARLPAPIPDERDLLVYLPERTASSRLSCQIELTDALSGIRVHVPPETD
jgi:2Fe-2S ferredoxin